MIISGIETRKVATACHRNFSSLLESYLLVVKFSQKIKLEVSHILENLRNLWV